MGEYVDIYNHLGGTWSLFLSCLTSIREGKEGAEGRKRGQLVTEWLSGGKIGAKEGGGNTFMGVS